MTETNVAFLSEGDPWRRLAVGSPWDGFALSEEIPLWIAAQSYDDRQPTHRAALAFLQAAVETGGWADALAADGITHVRDLFGAGGTGRRLLQWLEEQLPLSARERFARYWHGWEEAPPPPDRPNAHWLTDALETWDPLHPPHQAALAYLEGALRERGLELEQPLWEVLSQPENLGAVQARVGSLPSSVAHTFQKMWLDKGYLHPWVQRAQEYNGHPQQIRAIAWLEGRLAAQDLPSVDLLQLFERSRQRDREAIARLQQLERAVSPDIRQRFSEHWEA